MNRKSISSAKWVEIKGRCGFSQEELDWLWNYLVADRKSKSKPAPAEEELPQEIENIFASLAKGQFLRTQQNVTIVKHMLRNCMIPFREEDLEPNQ
jgi:hypothetical protein